MEGWKIRQSMFTVQLSSAYLPSIWRFFYWKKIIKIQIEIFTSVGLDNDWSNREDQPLLGATGGSASEMMNQYHQRKADTLDEQDRGLDALKDIIVRQKNLAQNIHAEVGAHNDLIDDIDDGLERTTHRITTTTENIRIVGRQDSVWRYWLAIFLLFIVIIVIIAVH